MGKDKIPVLIDSELAEIVPGFLNRRREDIATLRGALARGDFARLRAMGHNLKGTGGGYGFDLISDLGARIEQGSLAGDPAAIGFAIDELADYLESIEISYI